MIIKLWIAIRRRLLMRRVERLLRELNEARLDQELEQLEWLGV